jgi:hypothetical protein
LNQSGINEKYFSKILKTKFDNQFKFSAKKLDKALMKNDIFFQGLNTILKEFNIKMDIILILPKNENAVLI